MKWGLAAAVASAAAVAAASGAELLACDCDASAAPAATVGRCDGLGLSRQHHGDGEVRLPRIKDFLVSLSCLTLPSRFTFRERGLWKGIRVG